MGPGKSWRHLGENLTANSLTLKEGSIRVKIC